MQINLATYGYTVCKKNWKVDFSNTIKHTVYYCVSGEVYCVYNNEKFKLKANKLYIFPMFCNCQITHNPENPFEVLWFQFDMFPKLENKIYNVTAKNNIYKKYIKLMISAVEKGDEVFSFLANSLINCLIKDKLIDLSRDDKITCALEYINKNFNKNISNQELSDLLSYNKRYLISLFKKNTGLSPHMYQKRVRYERARILLQKGVSVKEVSEICGFSSANIVSREIKKIYGINAKDFKLIDENIMLV